MTNSNKSPFKLSNINEYQQWRDSKLKRAQTNTKKTIINIKMTPPTFLTDLHSNAANEAIIAECYRDNYCLYSIEDHETLNIAESRDLVNLLAKDCGVSQFDGNICADNDGLTSICISKHEGQHEYIPYTDKKLNWHTDGYYNLLENTIHSMLLHCFHAAENGGESAFLDHEIVYILLRDQNPDWIRALTQDNVMTIPANILKGKTIRAEQTGPVFSLSPLGQLHMRYSARKKNIIWNQDKDTSEAIDFLQRLLNVNDDVNYNVDNSDIEGSEYIVRRTLKAGQGIISRNVLHCRSSFTDKEQANEKRLLFRGRFHDELS